MAIEVERLKPNLQITVTGVGVLITLFMLSTPMWDTASRNDWHIIVPAAAACFLITMAIFAAWKSDFQWFPHGVAARFVLLTGFVVPLLWGRLLAGQINTGVIGGLFICGLFTALYGLLYWLAEVNRIFKSGDALTLTVLLLIVAVLGLPGLFHSASLARQANVAGFGYIVAPLLWFGFAGYGFYTASRSTR